jgi:hypothetical protein
MGLMNLKSLVLRDAVVRMTVNVLARKDFGQASGQYPALLSQSPHSSPHERLGTQTEPWCEAIGLCDGDRATRGAGRLRGFLGVRPCGELRFSTASLPVGLWLTAAN